MAGLFDASEFSPHGFCLAWDPAVLRVHVISDGLIALAYFSIPIALGCFVVKRRDLAFSWVFVLFALFILACGTTHLLDIWTLWHADYEIQGAVKAVTALASLFTAILLWRLMPKALALPSPAALRLANQRLSDEIDRRKAAMDALRREIADRQRTETMLRQAQRMEAVGQLTGGVAHDFNNLLMVIQGNLEMMREAAGADGRIEKYVTRALRGVGKGTAMIGQLLAFARQQPLEPKVLNLNDRVHSVMALLPGAVGGGIDLSLGLETDLWPVRADPTQIDSALLNLALNARDAMPDGGRLLIRTANVAWDATSPDLPATAPAGDYVAVSVTDSGVGMTSEVRHMAFEPFFTTKAIGRGSGLGLSQVHGFVSQSSGFVLLDSEPGQGTTITIHLPRAPLDAPGRSWP